MPVKIDGLVSGIDTQNIIDGLLKIQKQQVDRFAVRKSEVQAKQAAFKGVETRLLSLQLDATKLARSQNNPFTKQKVTVSDESAIAGSASESAATGVYRFTVNSRAAAHQVASQGFADSDSEISTGTFEIRQGNGDVMTITVDSSNNSLAGIADSINAKRGSVTANVVKDSSGGSTPYKLLLTSSKTGVDNSISLTNNLAASSGTAVRPEIDFGTPVQAAADASITFGSGAGAISTTSSTNRFDNVVRGVSFDLLNPTVGQEVALTIGRDTSSAVEDVQTFVTSFNDLIQYVDDQSRYVSATADSGPLLGNRNVQTIKQKLFSNVLDVVPGVGSNANRLSAIGISVTDSGRLQLDSSKLQSILDGQVEGVSGADVKRLFALSGSSDNPGVNFVVGTSKTKSSATPVQVNITQAAEQAALTANSALNSTVAIGASNNQLALKINGTEATVTLASGSYNQQELANLLETTLNSTSSLAGSPVSVGLADTSLKISTKGFGSTSKIEILSGSGMADLGLVAAQSATGKDVVGTFRINGENETATGRGQMLAGDTLNANTDGLQVRVTLSAANISSETDAELTVTRGLGAILNKSLDEMLAAHNGLAATTNTGFDKQLTDLQASMDRQQAVFDRQQEQLSKQFSALESAISSLQSTSSYVSAQLANLTGLSR
ncbi:MAG TPA: flagellar filament capping protein FliD [Planctomycetaceae bacterium]|mgnify:FL=1|nr:flagellar filament capping protein FliD [Planctomycetaceae bacterium]HQZ64922.1 flagellar filament capping protein FliD [Planctomycetaceae bacterium]